MCGPIRSFVAVFAHILVWKINTDEVYSPWRKKDNITELLITLLIGTSWSLGDGYDTVVCTHSTDGRVA